MSPNDTTVLVGDDKKGTKERLERLDKVEGESPTSDLCLQNPEVGAACAKYLGSGTNYRKRVGGVNACKAALFTARSDCDAAELQLDKDYAFFAALLKKHAVSSNDLVKAGMDARDSVASYTLLPPVSVKARFDEKTGLVLITIKRAPGMKVCQIEISTNPSDPTSWKAILGTGARQKLSGFAPGIYWVRVAHRASAAQSPFSAPIAVTVR